MQNRILNYHDSGPKVPKVALASSRPDTSTEVKAPKKEAEAQEESHGEVAWTLDELSLLAKAVSRFVGGTPGSVTPLSVAACTHCPLDAGRRSPNTSGRGRRPTASPRPRASTRLPRRTRRHWRSTNTSAAPRARRRRTRRRC